MSTIKFTLPFLLGLGIYALGTPEGMDPHGWKLLAIFVGTISGLILKPLPLGGVALIGMLITILSDTLKIEPEMLSGYGTSVIWLVVYVFFIARGFIKTKLGIRVAFQFVKLFGRNPLGLGYSLVATEFLMAPFIPSIAARAGGIMLPIVKSMSEALGSRPDNGTERQLGSFLFQTIFQTNVVTSAMFLTAMASNPMVQSLAGAQGIELTWTNWALAASVPGILSLIIIPLFIYLVYPPTLKSFNHAPQLAQEKLRDLGPFSQKEGIMVLIFALMLGLWIKGEAIGISTTTTALGGVCLLLVTKILTWDDILEEKEAWHTLIWFAVLVTMAKYLQVYGVISWFSNLVSHSVSGFSWQSAFAILLTIYFYIHYLFASNTSHIGAMYATFLAVAVGMGTPPLLAALSLGFASNLFASLTHYASSSAPIFFGAGYVPVGTWWRLGFLISLINIVIWYGIGSAWWKVVGIW